MKEPKRAELRLLGRSEKGENRDGGAAWGASHLGQWIWSSSALPGNWGREERTWKADSPVSISACLCLQWETPPVAAHWTRGTSCAFPLLFLGYFMLFGLFWTWSPTQRIMPILTLMIPFFLLKFLVFLFSFSMLCFLVGEAKEKQADLFFWTFQNFLLQPSRFF